MSRQNLFRNRGAAASFFLLLSFSSVAWAGDTSKEVRPSHLLNIETAGTQNANNLVLTMFGTGGGRAAYGVTNDLEVRADYAWNTLVNTGTAYNLAATGKYHLWSNEMFGVAAQATISNGMALQAAPAVTNFAGRVPFTLKFSPVLFTAVAVVSKTTATGSLTVYGGEFGLAFPLASFVDVIGEYTVYHKTGVTNLGWDAGFAFKPANRVTIPLVVASGAGGKNTGVPNATHLGILNFLAHVGFEL